MVKVGKYINMYIADLNSVDVFDMLSKPIKLPCLICLPQFIFKNKPE